MSAAFHLTHDNGEKEIIRDPVEALRKFLATVEDEEQSTLHWSS